MLIFTLAISFFTMFNLPWFVDLIFHIPMQYCSLQHRTLLSPSDTSTTECHFCSGPAASFFLELLVTALGSSPVAYWTPTDLRGSSFSVISFCLFILSMGFSRQEYWSGLPFPPLVDHILSELLTMTHLSWVALHQHGSQLQLSYQAPSPQQDLWFMKEIQCLNLHYFVKMMFQWLPQKLLYP